MHAINAFHKHFAIGSCLGFFFFFFSCGLKIAASFENKTHSYRWLLLHISIIFHMLSIVYTRECILMCVWVCVCLFLFSWNLYTLDSNAIFIIKKDENKTSKKMKCVHFDFSCFCLAKREWERIFLIWSANKGKKMLFWKILFMFYFFVSFDLFSAYFSNSAPFLSLITVFQLIVLYPQHTLPFRFEFFSDAKHMFLWFIRH